jgi:hypothetical protein
VLGYMSLYSVSGGEGRGLESICYLIHAVMDFFGISPMSLDKGQG